MLPFGGERSFTLVLPAADPTLAGSRALLELERAELDAVLGATVELAEHDPGKGPRWLLSLDSAAA